MPYSAFSRFSALARRTALACALGAGLVATPSHAVVVNEIGDAGSTQASAQAAYGAVTDIVGMLFSSLDADLYVIDIANPATFSASTVNATGGFLDTQLFLLTLAGAPVALNDDAAGGQSVLSTLPAGGVFAPVTAGRYLLGVAMSGFDPVNLNNQLLFAAGLSTTVRGPASGLQPAVLGGFADDTFAPDSGSYDIQLTGLGVAVPAVPEPSAAGLLLLGGAVGVGALSRRGRRMAAKAAPAAV